MGDALPRKCCGGLLGYLYVNHGETGVGDVAYDVLTTHAKLEVFRHVFFLSLEPFPAQFSPIEREIRRRHKRLRKEDLLREAAQAL
jgi:hypothetical protein